MNSHQWRSAKPSSGVRVLCHLSPRQREVLLYVSNGYTLKEMADKMNLETKTVEYHMAALKHKANIFDVAGLTKLALRLGLTDIYHHHTITEGVEIRE